MSTQDHSKGKQGRVLRPKEDKHLAANRNGPNGQGRVKDPSRDKRLKANKQAEGAGA